MPWLEKENMYRSSFSFSEKETFCFRISELACIHSKYDKKVCQVGRCKVETSKLLVFN